MADFGHLQAIAAQQRSPPPSELKRGRPRSWVEVTPLVPNEGDGCDPGCPIVFRQEPTKRAIVDRGIKHGTLTVQVKHGGTTLNVICGDNQQLDRVMKGWCKKNGRSDVQFLYKGAVLLPTVTVSAAGIEDNDIIYAILKEGDELAEFYSWMEDFKRVLASEGLKSELMGMKHKSDRPGRIDAYGETVVAKLRELKLKVTDEIRMLLQKKLLTRESMILEDNFDTLSLEEVEQLYRAIDAVYFNGTIAEISVHLKFGFVDPAKTIAGVTSWWYREDRVWDEDLVVAVFLDDHQEGTEHIKLRLRSATKEWSVTVPADTTLETVKSIFTSETHYVPYGQTVAFTRRNGRSLEGPVCSHGKVGEILDSREPDVFPCTLVGTNDSLFLTIPYTTSVTPDGKGGFIRRKFAELRKTNGRICRSRRECLTNVFMHEAAHALINCLCPLFPYGKRSYRRPKVLESHDTVFALLTEILFGHTNPYGHDLYRPVTLHRNPKDLAHACLPLDDPRLSPERHSVIYTDAQGKKQKGYPLKVDRKRVSVAPYPLRGFTPDQTIEVSHRRRHAGGAQTPPLMVVEIRRPKCERKGLVRGICATCREDVLATDDDWTIDEVGRYYHGKCIPGGNKA